MELEDDAHADSFRITRRGFLAGAGSPVLLLNTFAGPGSGQSDARDVRDGLSELQIPDWVFDVTRMAFVAAGDVGRAASAGAQVVHTNLPWPYYPLRRHGGGLKPSDADALLKLVADCRKGGMRLVLGLPPFPPVSLVSAHPEWRVHPIDDPAAVRRQAPKEDDLGTRVLCNNGPWGDHLIEVCAELIEQFGVDGFSFDGNYHAALCFCDFCKAGYRKDLRRPLPPKVDLDSVPYREYLVWRGERLEEHYRKMQQRIKSVNADAVLMSWTVNAGRYGHFLTSPRAMPTSLNRLFDLPMQEWWLDETNLGGSIAPAFGAAYLRATTGGRPCACEPYLMSRGNPYGTDSFPAHERMTRGMLAITSGTLSAESLGWPGHERSAVRNLAASGERAPWITRAEAIPWAGLLVSEQTRQFYAYRDIAERFLPHVLGAFRAMTEEHLPVTLLNDWDLTPEALHQYAVIMLPNAAALSNDQAAAVREYVQQGGGLVATGEASLCDDIGQPRPDFALADLFGVSFRGRPTPAAGKPTLDANFASTLDENYWRQRIGVATLALGDHPITHDARLMDLVPTRSVSFRGPLTLVTEARDASEVIVRMKPEGWAGDPVPAAVARSFGKGRVVYFAAAVDAALWSYSYPYQRRLLCGALSWAAPVAPPISVKAPMCVQATYFTQQNGGKERVIVHLFNGVNSAGGHGLPAVEVPLREESVPIHDIEVLFHENAPRRFSCEPGRRTVQVRKTASGAVAVRVPPLEIHFMLVGEY